MILARDDLRKKITESSESVITYRQVEVVCKNLIEIDKKHKSFMNLLYFKRSIFFRYKFHVYKMDDFCNIILFEIDSFILCILLIKTRSLMTQFLPYI